MNNEKNKIKFVDIIFYIVAVILIIFLIQGRIRNFLQDKKFIGKEVNFSKIIDINNNEYDLTNDKLILFVFWANWCNPCILEIPILNDIHKEMKEKVLILAINSTEDLETIKNAINKHNISYPVIQDKNGELSNFFNIKSIPTIIFIKDKKVLKIKHGYSPLLKNDLKKFVK